MKAEKDKAKTIKQDCLNQNKKFRAWASKNAWNTFHSSHYDWWAFPIDKGSSSYGNAYKVGERERKMLFDDQQFVQAVKENAVLVCRSWGWDLENGKKMKDVGMDQKWQRWPIRLSKMCRSLEIFNIHPHFIHAIQYAILLLKEFKKFTYGGKDLTPYFYKKWEQKDHFMKMKNQKKQEMPKEVKKQTEQKNEITNEEKQEQKQKVQKTQ